MNNVSYIKFSLPLLKCHILTHYNRISPQRLKTGSSLMIQCIIKHSDTNCSALQRRVSRKVDTLFLLMPHRTGRRLQHTGKQPVSGNSVASNTLLKWTHCEVNVFLILSFYVKLQFVLSVWSFASLPCYLFFSVSKSLRCKVTSVWAFLPDGSDRWLPI